MTGSAAISLELIPPPVKGLSAIVTHTHTHTGAIESDVESRRHPTHQHSLRHIHENWELKRERVTTQAAADLGQTSFNSEPLLNEDVFIQNRQPKRYLYVTSDAANVLHQI